MPATLMTLMAMATVLDAPPLILPTAWLSSDDYKWDTTVPPTILSYDEHHNNVIDITAAVAGLVLTCSATFPVEWQFHHQQLRQRGNRGRWLTTVTTLRKSGDIFKETSFQYSADLRFMGDANSITGNYTCQKVGDPSVASSVYVYWEGTSPPFLINAGQNRTAVVDLESAMREVILPCRIARPELPGRGMLLFKFGDKYQNNTPSQWDQIKTENNDSITYDPTRGYILTRLMNPLGDYKCAATPEPDTKDFLLVHVIPSNDPRARPLAFNASYVRYPASFSFDKDNKQFVCCSRTSTAPKMMHFYCMHPVTCVLRKNALFDMENTGKRLSGKSNCAAIKLHIQTAGVLRCQGDGVDMVLEYFFPMGFQFGFGSRRGRRNVTVEPPFYSWDDAKPEKMISVRGPASPIYVGQNVTFGCQASNFYFSRGIRWLIEWKNHTTLLIEEEISNSTSILGHQFFRRNINSLEIPVTLDLSAAYCYAPVWNTSKWENKTISVTVKVPIVPEMVGDKVEVMEWYLNDTGKLIECRAGGEPVPYFYWKKDGQYYFKGVQRQNGSSTVNFTRISYEQHGEYICSATNVGGTVTKTFRIIVKEKTSTGAVVIVVLCVIGLLLCIGGIGFLVHRLRQQKGIINHLAASAFKEVEESQPRTAPSSLFTVNNSEQVNGNGNGGRPFDEGNYHKL